ncbi:protein kinase family protein [Desulforhopalus singaporensis]|uniref:Protein kinase domain-containing protein n=1 Tax=Desulforhopalus singaporensis TaxID=91360 RepID=A0A1H0UNV8_9BACT|nr:hypothetical protein [Desulforhopalus singaporensis]SDP67992.1 hypothetical protein SAMN05660330_03665 [Desulforhopalus singaporensis]
MVNWSAFPEHILPRMKQHPALRSLRHQPKLFSDTSDFGNIDYGDVIHVDNRYFLVVGHTKEGRFGIDEQPKQWVPKVLDLESGQRQIVKLVFHETYKIRLGPIEITCYRNPEKEAQVIELTRGNDAFMQGYATLDEADNLVRILDIVNGTRLDKYIYKLGEDHRDYLENHLYNVLQRYLLSIDAIIHLHQNGLKHGDIRRDHIFVDRKKQHFVWIDFDYDFYLPERPFALDLLGLGSVLLFLVGQDTFRTKSILQNPQFGEKVFNSLEPQDMALLSQDRIFNLKKIYPYIPDPLNELLLHFSMGTTVMYDEVKEFYDDLCRVMDMIW